jgi:uncharacterized protein (TIGR03437 family)
MRLFGNRSAVRLALAALVWLGSEHLMAAQPNRITRPVDASRTVAVPGHLHALAQAQFDAGAVDPGMPMNYMVLMAKLSPAQQSELDQLLAGQQNPSSPSFRKWLTPEEFGNRFGFSSSDNSKVAAWLNSEGFKIEHLARSRNWIAFSGTAAQVSRSLHTPIHRFQVGGKTRFANTSEPSVPAALSEVVGGFLGLNDFPLETTAKLIPPDYNSGSFHYLVPEDFATIYDLMPLYQAGIDGTGQNIAVVGQSDVLLSDIRAFRSRYNLPANDPKMLPYGIDPGFNGAQVEGNLDLEWAGAIAPKATLTYVYGPSAFTAIVAAVESNVAPIVTASYGSCEVNYSAAFYRAIAQQANAQGITLVSSSGDTGADGCGDSGPSANHGRVGHFPTTMPEVTSVGGTQFAEGTGTYWASTNSPNFGSALSYIPEAVWNESSPGGLAAGGGGASLVYPKPTWQTGPGVPSDNARHYPDVALSAAGHDAYFITFSGTNGGVAGTSAAAPSMAGIIALLNQYQVSKGFQKLPGLGNINPQLYRLAQSAPSAFHDITVGDNLIPCTQGSPDCLTGSIGYHAAPGFDMATGLGSVDGNNLVTQWNTATNAVVVTLSANTARATLNDTLQLTASVAPASGNGTPSGSVDFIFDGIPFGTVALTNGSASQAVPLYLIGATGSLSIAAEYSGDAAFSAGGATVRVQVILPAGVAVVVPSAPNTVWAAAPDAQGLSWQTSISLRELAGVPAMLTGLTIDGQTQTLSQYFPSSTIPANGSVTASFVFRNLEAPVTRTFVFNGVDATGQTWSRQVAVKYLPPLTSDYSTVTVTPLTIAQNTAADSSCQWAAQLNLDEIGGTRNVVTGLLAGNVNLSSFAQISSILGSPRLDAWKSLQGTLCFGGVTPPGTDTIEVDLNGVVHQLTVSFAGPPSNPGKISTSPATINLVADSSGNAPPATLAVTLSDKTQPWSASVYPANRTTAWLSLSQFSGTGSGQITLTASSPGFEPGAYRATIVIQSPNAIPQYLNIPVMYVLGGSSSGPAITAVANTASFKTVASPGMLFSIFGSNLASATQSASTIPLPYTLANTSVTINGTAAPLLYVSATQLNVQIPYEAGTGPSVVSVNNNGQIGGFEFQISPAAPGIFTDSNVNLVPAALVTQGGYATLYVTGVGEVSTLTLTGFAPSTLTPLASLPTPVLPLSATVGGIPAFVQFAGIPGGLVGTAQVNILVPSSVPLGKQQVVVTVGGVSSLPVNVTVQAQAQ